jgi:hypothetical protein
MTAKGMVEQLEQLEGFTNEAQYQKDGGRFLPLSVYATQGFDIEAIRTKSAPENIMNDPVLGLVYRVRILDTGTDSATGTKRTTLLSQKVVPKAKAKAGPIPIQGDVPVLALADGDPDGNGSESEYSESGNSSNSGSESSSRSKHHRKKSKKSKKSKHSKKNKKSKKEKKSRKSQGGRGAQAGRTVAYPH